MLIKSCHYILAANSALDRGNNRPQVTSASVVSKMATQIPSYPPSSGILVHQSGITRMISLSYHKLKVGLWPIIDYAAAATVRPNGTSNLTADALTIVRQLAIALIFDRSCSLTI